jgi:hypothetical protein
MDDNRPSVRAIAALIARTPIAIGRLPASLPAGFDEVDAAILAWIAAEGRRIGRGFVRM